VPSIGEQHEKRLEAEEIGRSTWGGEDTIDRHARRNEEEIRKDIIFWKVESSEGVSPC